MPGSAAMRPGGQVVDDRGDLLFQAGGLAGQGGDPLSEAGQGLIEHGGLAVGAGRDGQRRAGRGALLAGQVPQLLAQPGGRRDDDRGQQGAGGLAGLHRVVPVTHQQPQRLAVTIGAHHCRYRAGQQLTRGPDRVDRVAFALTPAADVLAGVDFLDVLPGAGQVPGQAQPVMPGALDGPAQPAAGSSIAGPAQHRGVSLRIRADLQAGQFPAPRVADRGGMGVQVSIDTDHQALIHGNAHDVSSLAQPCWTGGTGLEGNSRGNPVMSHGQQAGQAPDQANEGGQAGARGAGDKSLERHVRRRSGTLRVTRHHQAPTWPAPPAGNARTSKAILTGPLIARTRGCGVPPRWCREDPAASA